MLRNCFDWDCKEETNFWEVICDKYYPIEELPSKTRNQIRRCLRDCEIRIISTKELVDANGYRVYRSAFSRYHDVTIKIIEREKWENSIKKDHTHEFWGVFEKETNSLIAWALNSIHDEYVEYNTLKAVPDMMNKHYPYFGLLYEMNRHYLEECGCQYVTDGWRSITEHSGIQPFLEKNFKFRKAYTRIKLYYAGWFGLAVRLLFPFRNSKFLPLNVRYIMRFEEINRGCMI